MLPSTKEKETEIGRKPPKATLDRRTERYILEFLKGHGDESLSIKISTQGRTRITMWKFFPAKIRQYEPKRGTLQEKRKDFCFSNTSKKNNQDNKAQKLGRYKQ